MSAVSRHRHTVAEYLALERTRDFRSEYYRGEMFAMVGGSMAHRLIAANFIRELGNVLKHRPCRVFTTDMRVECPSGLFTYSDVSVVCGEPQLRDDHHDTLQNPLLIAEVLSESTEAYDRGRKFELYRSIPSLRDYLLIPQDRACIQRFSRPDTESHWTVNVIDGIEASLPIPSLAVTVPMVEIYAKADLPAAEALTQPDERRF